MTSGCIFCGTSPTTKTHVFRKAWLEKLMPGPGGHFIHRHFREGTSGFDVTWTRDSFDVQPNAACESCNGGWMHTLEHMGENLVGPCVHGGGTTFSPNTHRTLSRWILMCMVVLDQIQERPVVEQPIRDLLMNNLDPPADCRVWLAATDSAADEINVWPRSWRMVLSSGETDGYFCTFRIKHFVAQGFISLGSTSKDLTFDRSGGTGQHVVQVWPSDGAVTWPPPLLIPGDQIELFSRAFES